MSALDKTIGEHDVVVLLRDVPEHRLAAGDMAVVVDIGRDAGGRVEDYLLEVFAANGATLDVVSVEAGAVRAARNDEAPSVRSIAAE